MRDEPEFGFPRAKRPWSAVAILLTINIGVFLCQVLFDPGSLDRRFGDSITRQWLALDTADPNFLLPLQLFVFQFLHGGVGHLLINMLMLYFIGRSLEQAIGRGELVGLYLASGVMGGLLQLLFALLMPSKFAAPLVGASAGVFGFMAVLARMYPRQEVYLLLFFVLPVRIQLRWLLWGSIGLAMLGILMVIQTHGEDNVAHTAHLGGILFGVMYVAWLVNKGGLAGLAGRLPRIRVKARPANPGTQAVAKKKWRKPRVVEAQELPNDEFISREVDPILDKISKKGIHSLTSREREILDQARTKMRL